jgi:Domain of unknown function (DUF4386)
MPILATAPAESGPRPPTTSLRRTALVAGVLYLITFVSIPTLFLYGPVLSDPGFVVGPGPDGPIMVGGLLEIIVALAGVGTAVVLYPVVRRQNRAAALGFVASRTLEGAAIVGGVACLLTMVTLRQAGLGPDAVVTGRALVAAYNWEFLLGQSLMPAVNGLLLGSLLYRSRLVPRILPAVGLVGAVLLLGSDLAVLFGLWPRLSGPSGLLAIPIALWELSLGIYLVVKGFRPSPITAGLDVSRR